MKDYIEEQDEQPKNVIFKYAKFPQKNNQLRKNSSKMLKKQVEVMLKQKQK